MSRVIVKFQDGQEKMGDVLIFNAKNPTFHLQSLNDQGKLVTQTVRTDTVKMVLFLRKEESGKAQVRTEKIDQTVYAGTSAFRLALEFMDGELIIGSAHKYNPNEKGFFVVPMNPGDISEKIYVNAGALKHVDCKRLLGKILVDQEKITFEQLQQSLKYQQEKREKKLGDILLEASVINEKQLQESLEKQNEKNMLLGEILLEAGYISLEQLDEALSVQKQNRTKRLGQILVELKYITANDICIALATQFQCPWVDLSQVEIPPAVAASLSADVVRRFEVIPIDKKNGSVLVIATSQPQNTGLLPELQNATSYTVELVVAFEGYIESAIKHHFPEHTG